ncbi:MAG: PAS domain S-box protein [bacterium]|nr:PAS domain S-box protein [bacterium]
MRYPLYLILLLLALPLLITGWYADRSLGRFQQELAQLLLSRHLSEDLSEQPRPLDDIALAQMVARQEMGLWVYWLDSTNQVRAVNRAESPAELEAKDLMDWSIRQPAAAPLHSAQGRWVMARSSLEVYGRPGEWLFYLRASEDFGDRLLPFHRTFWAMALFGGLAALLVGWYYWMRVQRPIDLILKKDRLFSRQGLVQEAQIDRSLIGRHDLGDIMTSRNEILEKIFLDSARQDIILNSLHDALFVFGPDAKIKKINFPAAMLVGKSEPELIGKQAADLATNPNQPWIDHWWNNYRFSSEHPTFEAQLKSSTDEAIPVLCSAELLISPSGQFDGMLLVCRDLSHAKQLQAEVDLLSMVAEQSPVGLLVMDLTGQVEQVNQAFEEISGRLSSELVGEPWDLLGSPELPPPLRTELGAALNTRSGWTAELRFERPGGSIWQRHRLIPVRDSLGHVVRFALLVEDITEPKRLELALKEANRDLEFKVEERVAELKEATEKLERANQDLTSLDRLKDEFLAVASHELRTPLAAIIGYAESLIELNLDPGQRNKFLNTILSESERLSLLINEVLDLSAMAAGKLEFRWTQVDLDAVVGSALDTLAGLAGDKKIQLDFEPSGLKLSGDPDRLVQLLINLVGNALKFSPIQGKVEVRAGVEGPESIRLEVRDFGRGIPEGAMDQIFDRFHQIENPETNRKGTGLGLTLARMIVEAHGGQIWAENREPGALFICLFPVNHQGESDV